MEEELYQKFVENHEAKGVLNEIKEEKESEDRKPWHFDLNSSFFRSYETRKTSRQIVYEKDL